MNVFEIVGMSWIGCFIFALVFDRPVKTIPEAVIEFVAVAPLVAVVYLFVLLFGGPKPFWKS